MARSKTGVVIRVGVVHANVAKLSMSKRRLKRLLIKLLEKKIFHMAMDEYTQVNGKADVNRFSCAHVI